MDTSFRTHYSPYWNTLQKELLPMKASDLEGTSPTLERLIRVLEWVRIEEHVSKSLDFGRPQVERTNLARAFCAKATLGMECTTELIERLQVDSKLRRICGFEMWRKLPSKSTFSRAFAQFAKESLAEKAHETMIKQALGNHLIGSLSRDATAIVSREKPKASAKTKKSEVQQKKTPYKRGRPRKGEVREDPEQTRIQIQRGQTLEQNIAQLPRDCTRGTKQNAQGYKHSWNGHKLHLDVADCGVIISALTTSASLHDSLAAIALSRKSEQRVQYCYELADAAYCSNELREDSISRGHVPLFDHNPRNGEKKEFAPHEAQRYKARSGVERANAELKDRRGLRQVWVRGFPKVNEHLMFAVLTLSAEQLMRLLL